MKTGVTCASCGGTIYGDDEKVKIDIEWRRHGDPDEHDEYFMHPDCSRDELADWEGPE